MISTQLPREEVVKQMADIAITVITQTTDLVRINYRNGLSKDKIIFFQNDLTSEGRKRAIENIEKYRQDILDKKSNGEVSTNVGGQNVSISFLFDLTDCLMYLFQMLESKEYQYFDDCFICILILFVLFSLLWSYMKEYMEAFKQNFEINLKASKLSNEEIKSCVDKSSKIYDKLANIFLVTILGAFFLFILVACFHVTDLNVFIQEILEDKKNNFNFSQKHLKIFFTICVLLFTIFSIYSVVYSFKKVLEIRKSSLEDLKRVIYYQKTSIKFILWILPTINALLALLFLFCEYFSLKLSYSELFKNFLESFEKTFSEQELPLIDLV